MPQTVDVLLASAGEVRAGSAPMVPEYAHPGDAGADLHAAEAAVLEPGARATIGTGVAIALPDGFAAFVLPRSGLASRHGISLVNGPGTVDAGYRGEIRVTLLNTDPAAPYAVAIGDRIAQLVVLPVARARFVPVESLPGSHRGAGGFGSTGYRAEPQRQGAALPRPEQAPPDRAAPDHARPDQVRPDHARPGQTRSGETP